ncbi:succinate dehydrogenase/fumarate reductase iron-sulfur subunit [Hymenobacter sp. ISL-91]|nr:MULTISPECIES: succinate dehydrogenase/fumarate reductase iron-sulfur subunit [Hymenobacter]MBT2557982.1 succinate dehydrogenase/fumarate reductase iron-sulfur subunit [Hymenobacter sp. ISL-91]
MHFTLRIWRQKNRQAQGAMMEYVVEGISAEMSFLEMLDVLNEDLLHAGHDPVAFDYDCREGICGSCSLFINGRAHGPQFNTASCQLYMRTFTDGSTITIEPWRARAFPLNKDLSCDRSAFDRIMQAGGYVSVNTGGAPDGNEILISKAIAERAFESATCIGCGACVAACKNSSAVLFVGAKVSELALLPQGQPERQSRVENMVAQMNREGFGSCSNIGSCAAECPAGITLADIATLNHEYLMAKATSEMLA